jgi:hypothetical protein
MENNFSVNEEWLNKNNRNQYNYVKDLIKKEELKSFNDQRDYVIF